jgi:hypothetical protein
MTGDYFKTNDACEMLCTKLVKFQSYVTISYVHRSAMEYLRTWTYMYNDISQKDTLQMPRVPVGSSNAEACIPV